MHAAVVNVLGEVPRYQEFPDPTAGDGEAVVQMVAAGLHQVVKARASGKHYTSVNKVPLIPGVDGVGKLPDGRLVYCFTAREQFGTMAERVIVRPEGCIPVPDALDPLQAAAIVNPGMAGWLSLKLRAGLKAGETVLILGATGVAGGVAVQAARHLGAAKIIVAGRNVEALKALGADAIVPLGGPDQETTDALTAQLGAGGIDVVIDFLWGHPAELTLGALATTYRRDAATRTRYVEIGESAGGTISLPGAVLRSIDLLMLGSGFGSVPLKQIFGSIPELLSLAVAGHLKAAVEPVPLKDVSEAWNRVEKGKRIVFSV